MLTAVAGDALPKYTTLCTALHCTAPHPTTLHYITLHYTRNKDMDFGSLAMRCACGVSADATLRGRGNPRLVSQRMSLGVEKPDDHIDAQYGCLRAKAVLAITDLCKLSVRQ